jgi:hypothetical protein
LSLCFVVMAACPARPVVPETGGDAGTSGSGSSSTAIASTTSGGTAMPIGTTADADVGEGGGGFIETYDLPPSFCDIFEQDCRRGEKCMPYRFEDSTMFFDAAACFPVMPDPVGLYQPCTYQGATWSGYDDCGVGEVCWDIDGDALGFCKRICANAGECGPGEIVSTCQTCACFCDVACDVVAQDCPGDLRCVVGGYGYTEISCTEATASINAGIGEPCVQQWDCATGLSCVDAAGVPGCESGWCCTPYCDAEQPSACPLPGQECLQIWDGATGRLGAAGTCRVPDG